MKDSKAPVQKFGLLLLCLHASFSLVSPRAFSQEPPIRIRKNISYLPVGMDADAYTSQQCKLDLYLPPESGEQFPLLVWFHGGGLKGGSRSSKLTVQLAKSLAARGVGVALPDYRLNPNVQFPAYIQDAALAVHWAVMNRKSLDAAPGVFVGGHSAGGYIACLLAMDSRYFKKANISEDNIAGFIPISGQTMTHFTVAEERGFSASVITADDAAPIHYLKKDTPPILLLIGDQDWPARLEENLYFVSALQKVGGNNNVSLHVIQNRDHGSILEYAAADGDPAGDLVLSFVLEAKLPAEPSREE